MCFGGMQLIDRPESLQIHYIPTQEQIALACAQIQSTWTDEERDARRRGSVCVTKHESVGVADSARVWLDEKLTKRREAIA